MADEDGSKEIVSRKTAKALGRTFYFTGNQCKHGHIAPRYVSGAKCSQCGRENSERWASENAERYEARRRNWGKRNAEKLAQRARLRRKNNPEAELAKCARWRQKNREFDRERALRWRRQNPEIAAATTKKWRSNNLDKLSAKERNRRSRKAKSGGTHSAADIAAILAAQKGRCAYCRIKITQENKHVDHIIPISKGGRNDRRNLQVLCRTCNVKKHDRDPIDYMQAQGALL